MGPHSPSTIWRRTLPRRRHPLSSGARGNRRRELTAEEIWNRAGMPSRNRTPPAPPGKLLPNRPVVLLFSCEGAQPNAAAEKSEATESLAAALKGGRRCRSVGIRAQSRCAIDAEFLACRPKRALPRTTAPMCVADADAAGRAAARLRVSSKVERNFEVFARKL